MEALQKEKEQLQSKVGELLMDEELLEQSLARAEGEAPFRRGNRSDEPGLVSFRAASVWPGPGLPSVGGSAIDVLFPSPAVSDGGLCPGARTAGR